MVADLPAGNLKNLLLTHINALGDLVARFGGASVSSGFPLIFFLLGLGGSSALAKRSQPVQADAPGCSAASIKARIADIGAMAKASERAKHCTEEKNIIKKSRQN